MGWETKHIYNFGGMSERAANGNSERRAFAFY